MEIGNILGQVAVTLMWSLMIAAVAVTLYIVVKWFQNYMDKDDSNRNRFEDLRVLIMMMPFAWIMLNFNSDSNVIADTMFNFWLPVVIMSILTIGIVELILPFLSAASQETNRAGQRVVRRGALRRRRR